MLQKTNAKKLNIDFLDNAVVKYSFKKTFRHPKPLKLLIT